MGMSFCGPKLFSHIGKPLRFISHGREYDQTFVLKSCVVTLCVYSRLEF